MIQRIQSLFLLLGAGVIGGLFGLPFASTDEQVSSTLFADSLYNLNDHIALMVLFGLGGLLALVSIFLFKNRKLQMRMTIFSIIAIILGIVLTVVLFLQQSTAFGNVVVDDEVGAYLPLAGIILMFLAYRFIGKDEKIVRSMDRLR